MDYKEVFMIKDDPLISQCIIPNWMQIRDEYVQDIKSFLDTEQEDNDTKCLEQTQ